MLHSYLHPVVQELSRWETVLSRSNHCWA